jgi:hypothetical protein
MDNNKPRDRRKKSVSSNLTRLRDSEDHSGSEGKRGNKNTGTFSGKIKGLKLELDNIDGFWVGCFLLISLLHDINQYHVT